MCFGGVSVSTLVFTKIFDKDIAFYKIMVQSKSDYEKIKSALLILSLHFTSWFWKPCYKKNWTRFDIKDFIVSFLTSDIPV